MTSFALFKQLNSAGILLWLPFNSWFRLVMTTTDSQGDPSPTINPTGRDCIKSFTRAGRRMLKAHNGVGSANLFPVHYKTLKGNRQFVYEPRFLLGSCISTSLNSYFEQLFVTQPEIIKISTPWQPAGVKSEYLEVLGLNMKTGLQFWSLISSVK